MIRVSNPNRILRPRMSASVVEVAPRTFERRDVEVESLGGGELIARAGLSVGERVVTRGAMLRMEVTSPPIATVASGRWTSAPNDQTNRSWGGLNG